ncbi:MAG TPA: hypothetical protein DCP74_07425, partial [Bacteroidales bacterium]|nr:hypothetical protein [Bacteroidales bacterium]
MVDGRFGRYSIIIVIVLILSGCNKDESEDDKYLKSPVCTDSFIPKTSEFKVVGFYPSWGHASLPVSEIPWDKLTRIVYAFAVPNADGTLDTKDLTMIQELTETAHKHGVEVYVSIGGGDGSNNFVWIASKDEYTKRFVKKAKQYVFENCLDGVDIDWEYWSGYRTNTVVPSESNVFVYIIKSLKEELSPFGLGVSIDLGASHWGGKHFYDDVVLYADDLQVMCYDFSGPWSAPGPHSSYDQAIGSGST